MPRKAGNSDTYSFILRNKSNDSYDVESSIELPSVTTIIQGVMSKPALPPWFYRMTRDAFIGVVSLVKESQERVEGLTCNDFFDTFTDPDMVEEFLAENRLRPSDQAFEASERGQREHGVLVTANRNDAGPESLEATIQQQNTPQSLPVFTLANDQRVLRDRQYAEKVADRLIEALSDIDSYRGTGRIYLP